MGERLNGIQEVGSSILPGSTKQIKHLDERQPRQRGALFIWGKVWGNSRHNRCIGNAHGSCPLFTGMQTTSERVDQMEQPTTYFLGITPSDWLNAGVTTLGMFFAILTAVWISPRITDRQTRRDNQERLLRMLLNTRLIPANPDYQTAIAMIPLEFKGNEQVLVAHKRYLATVNVKVDQMDTNKAAEHDEITATHQNLLIAAMANALDFPGVTPDSLQSDGYVSQGFVNCEQMLMQAMQAWPRIAEAIEQSNSITLALWGDKLQVPVQTELEPAPEKGS